MTQTFKIAVLCATFNRVDVTLRGIASLYDVFSYAPADWDTQFFVLDDNSSDGTAKAIGKSFPNATLLQGTGGLYWNRGMCAAFDAAKNEGPFDAYLMFNDDILLDTDPTLDLLAYYQAANAKAPTICIGAFIDKATGQLTYSGFQKQDTFRPLNLKKIQPNGTVQACDTFNGNFVLIPGEVMEQLGGLDPIFHHAYGDLDLGYRAVAIGARIALWKHPIGHCEIGLRRCNDATIKERWRTKFLPPNTFGQHAFFIFRHTSALVALWLVPMAYARRLLRVIFPER